MNKATIHYWDEHGVARFKEMELNDLYELHEVHDYGHLSHVRIGNYSVAYDGVNLHVQPDAFAPKLADDMLPEEMRNDRVKSCRIVYALADYYIGVHGDGETRENVHPTRRLGPVPEVYKGLARACEEELEYWLNKKV